ncbi:hypothetical protein SAMN05216553_101193 [Lentzea fradiae]|uniref:V8-like Glu-specific endopeptidase n=1 Tax=Lentzea fradiae TaxID=200378 RepID=A0A1G7KCC6_9PSEU|nr:hypothetical protein [Lentzea fradiae]SDF34634.1 hypothetical protein SAMN05216553_101193 [Lentzea fradiae]
MSWKALSTTGVLIGAVLVTASPAQAAGQVVTRVAESDRTAALAYWTPERMRATGEDALPPAEQIARPYPGPPPAGVGRLFATTSQGIDLTCSATVVPSATKDVVFTAGHCLHGGWDRRDNPIKIVNVVFAPGYDHGASEVFAARAFAWSDTYSGPSSGADDDAVVALDPVGGRHVEDVAGAQDISFDEMASPADATLLGYPVSQLDNGESLLACDRPASLRANSVYSVWQTDCDLAPGSSGGPWLRGFDPATGKGTIFGVTSRGTMNSDLVTTGMDASVLTSAVRELYESAGRL